MYTFMGTAIAEVELRHWCNSESKEDADWVRNKCKKLDCYCHRVLEVVKAQGLEGDKMQKLLKAVWDNHWKVAVQRQVRGIDEIHDRYKEAVNLHMANTVKWSLLP